SLGGNRRRLDWLSEKCSPPGQREATSTDLRWRSFIQCQEHHACCGNAPRNWSRPTFHPGCLPYVPRRVGHSARIHESVHVQGCPGGYRSISTVLDSQGCSTSPQPQRQQTANYRCW